MMTETSQTCNLKQHFNAMIIIIYDTLLLN